MTLRSDPGHDIGKDSDDRPEFNSVNIYLRILRTGLDAPRRKRTVGLVKDDCVDRSRIIPLELDTITVQLGYFEDTIHIG